MTQEEALSLYRETLKELKEKLPIQAHCVVGSSFIVGPEEAKDLDLLVLLPVNSSLRNSLLSDWEWGYDETYPIEGDFESGRRGSVNLLLVNDPAIFKQWCLAANVCKYLKLSKKKDRVTVHQILMDDLPISTPFYESASNDYD